jgi:hypothetical protein
LNGNCAKAATSSIYALNRRKEASAADPIANPFVVAFVVLPTASRMSVISLTLSGCKIYLTGVTIIKDKINSKKPHINMIN